MEWPEKLVLALCFAFGFVGMSWNGVYASEVARLSQSDAVGRVMGACMFIVFSGVLLGPVGFIVMLRFTGAYSTAFVLTMIVSIGALVCALIATSVAGGCSSSSPL